MHLSFIQIFPIKSLDPVIVHEARITPGGSLQNDREFSFHDESGKWIRGKNEPKLHLIRSRFDLDARTVELTAPVGGAVNFHLDQDRPKIEVWMSAFLGYAVTLRQNAHHGFPDDRDIYGPTVLSAASIERVANWGGGLSLENVRRRFRANLEISDAPAFWEDGFYPEHENVHRFKIGSVEFSGADVCERCIVVTRDPETGSETKGFQREFLTRRKAEMPTWAIRSRMKHFFLFALCTRIHDGIGKILRVGDMLSKI